jgi:hypothetical protein
VLKAPHSYFTDDVKTGQGLEFFAQGNDFRATTGRVIFGLLGA